MDAATNAHAGTIVFGVDGSQSANRALAWAVDQAVADHRALTLAHAISPVGAVWLDHAGVDHRIGVEAGRTEGHELLRLAREAVAERAPDLEVHEVLRVVDPRELLLALSTDTAMVVLGSRGRGPVRSLLLGSVGVALSRHAHCPVVIHRPSNPGKVRHGVLVGIDGTAHSHATLEFAFTQASVRSLPLTVLHSFWDAQAAVAGPHRVDARASEFEEQRLLIAESVSGMGEKFPDVRMDIELARGYPGDCLVREGARMNMIVVGAHHGGAASGMVFGSAATSVVEHATCPVAVVPTTRLTGFEPAEKA
jgi:nucleotide-binding universal stress UspA family protein